MLETKRMHYLPMYNVNSVRGLHDMILDIVRPDFVIVEIGSFAGVSSDLFARYCSRLYCIDVWSSRPVGIEDDMMAKAELMFDKVWKSHPNIKPIQGESVEIASQFDDASIDMVYIDGEHSYRSVLDDILAWMPKVKPGGWVTGHDMILMPVQKAVREAFGERYGDIQVYEDTSWAIRL